MIATSVSVSEPSVAASPSHFSELEARIDAIAELSNPVGAAVSAEMLAIGEKVLEIWIRARGEDPTLETKEGFRLLALHRQGARGEPSFNACRETCRELVYHYNLINSDESRSDVARQVRLMTMVAKHLCLFVEGKMQVEGLGEFCCASKPVRADGN